MKRIKRKENKKILSFTLSLMLILNLLVFNYSPQVVNALIAEDPNRELTISDIPDSILYNRLKELADSNNDGKLIIAEMQAYKGDESGLLNLSNLGITNIKGLQYAKAVASMDLSGTNNITNIPDNIFLDFISLTSIKLPDTVESIGVSAFEGCTVLADINLPDGLTSIGEKSFFECKGLSGITLPAKIASIGNSAFSGSGLTVIDIPNPDVNMGISVFNGCKSLQEVKLPEGMKSIPMEAFKATGIMTINLPTTINTIEEGAFSGSSLFSMDLSAINNLTSIKTSAFSGTPLMEIKLPESLTELGSRAFENCALLPNITIPSKITVINELTFSNCTSLENVVFTPTETVNSINSYNLQEIRFKAFYGDTALGGETGVVSFLKNLNKLTSIGEMAFAYSSKQLLTKDEYGQYLYKGVTTIELPENLLQLGKSAFANGYSLRTMTIPNKVTVLDDKTFLNCYNLESITLSNTLTSIGVNTFEGNRKLSSIVFPESLTTIGNYAFLNCAYEKYKTVTRDDGTKGREYAYTGLESLVLPDSITSIGTAAFKGDFNLKAVKLPINLMKLSDSVFESTGIQLRDDMGILITDSYIGLEAVANFNKLTTIGAYAFKDSYKFNFKQEQFNSELTAVGAYAFRNTDIAGILRLPAKLTKIETSTFEGCKNITSVEFPDGLISIGNTSFKDCISLGSITILAAVTIVDKGTYSSFYGSNNFSNAIVKAVPSDISVMENSEVMLPIKLFTEITSIVVEDENIASAENRLDSYSRPQIFVKGVKEGLTKVTVKGSIQYEAGKDPLSGSPLVNRFETSVQFNVIVSAIKSTEVRFDQPIRGIKLSSTTGVLLNPVINPVDTTDLKLWSSDNEAVARVDNTGRVFPVSYGSTTITLKVGDQPEVQCEVNVCAPAYSMTLDKTSATLVLGNTITLNAAVTYSSTYDLYKSSYPEVVIWSSSNPNVATVDQSGNITSVGYGETTITAKADAAGIIRTSKVTVIPESTDVTFDRTSVTLTKGDTSNITMTLNPADSPLSKITVTTSNYSVASVSVVGNVITITARGGGTATITATPAYGTPAVCKVTVISPITAITVAPMQLNKGQTRTISVVKTPYDATDTLLYTSNNPSVATVDITGKVAAVSAGKAIITVSSENGLVKANCEVTVVVPVTSITLSKTTLIMNKYSSSQLTATILPSDATNKDFTWSSYNTSVATVDSNGVVRAVGAGSVIIMAKTIDGTKSASCTVTVQIPAGLKDRDINKDGKIDILDLSLVARAYNNRLGSTVYKSELDLNSDNLIDIFDLSLVSIVFTE